MNKLRIFPVLALCVAVALAVIPSSGMNAASSTKQFSTNFTLVNLDTVSDATVHIDYKLDSGAAWVAPAASTDFTIPKNGGQKIIRQYLDAMNPASGRGSAVVNSSSPLGAVVQILARGQNPTTSGAYAGFTKGDTKFYVPLVSRRGSSSSGTTNSQIMVQNTGSSPVNFTIQLIPAAGSTGSYSKPVAGLAGGATFYYDLDDEANLPTTPWFGAAVVDATGAGGGQVAVVSNFFTGPNGMQTFNAFPASSVGPTWLAPLVTVRLPSNNLSTPIAVQNLSGGTIAIGGVSLTCKKDPGLGGFSDLSLSNTAAIPNNGSYFWNPAVDTTHFPTGWYGSCRISAAGGKNIVAFVQMRFIGTDNAAAYEALNASGADKKVFVPLVAKRLASNGFATAVTIQNLSASASAPVTLKYTPSPDYVAGGGSAAVLQTTTTILANTSLIQNQRLGSFTVGATAMPDGWYGTLSVSSTGAAIGAFVQLTQVPLVGAVIPGGDTFMAHNAFTQP